MGSGALRWHRLWTAATLRDQETTVFLSLKVELKMRRKQPMIGLNRDKKKYFNSPKITHFIFKQMKRPLKVMLAFRLYGKY